VSLAEDLVVFRNNDASALRKICRSLHWEIAIDSCPVQPTQDDRPSGNPKLDPIDQGGMASRRFRTVHTL
jgi:hypothetical protein